MGLEDDTDRAHARWCQCADSFEDAAAEEDSPLKVKRNDNECTNDVIFAEIDQAEIIEILRIRD
jgi:hypothetical protein